MGRLQENRKFSSWENSRSKYRRSHIPPRNPRNLGHRLQLVELLEVPQLMDACVRSDLMEEALSIATFASTLERRHRGRRASSLSTASSSVTGAMRWVACEGQVCQIRGSRDLCPHISAELDTSLIFIVALTRKLFVLLLQTLSLSP